MITTVYTGDAWDWLRKDLKENLDWDGIEAIIDYYDDIDPTTEYDESLFYDWNVGGTCTEILKEIDGEAYDDAVEAVKDSEGNVDEDELEHECDIVLCERGTLLKTSRGKYLFQE